MQLPKRKPGKYANVKKDFYITKTKFNEIKEKLEKLRKSCPSAIEELQRLAALGDFSENAGYQIAKGKLRSINQRILEFENQLNYAVIIEANNHGIVQLGSIVVININNIEQTYQILGSAEANPSKGIISQNSPIGSALIGHKVGDGVELEQKNKLIKCKIIEIK